MHVFPHYILTVKDYCMLRVLTSQYAKSVLLVCCDAFPSGWWDCWRDALD